MSKLPENACFWQINFGVCNLCWKYFILHGHGFLLQCAHRKKTRIRQIRRLNQPLSPAEECQATVMNNYNNDYYYYVDIDKYHQKTLHRPGVMKKREKNWKKIHRKANEKFDSLKKDIRKVLDFLKKECQGPP